MLARGAGAIVAVTSAAALDGGDGESHDAAAQGATLGLVKALAHEFGPRGIEVNAVAAGAVDPEEIAATVVYLATEPHSMAGAVLSATAGAVA
jgi:NAD(P)-dependent dehydrogenase (short-subunit alcohol dehydrogenase family)